jgi:opacity protein-like surface antigen
MHSLKTCAVAGAVAIATTVAARASDTQPPPMPSYAPPVAVVGTGWYLRGDIGISEYQEGKFSSPNLPPAEFLAADFGSGSLAGLGVGFEFNNWFRADITGEYRFSEGFKVFDRVDFDAGGVPGVTRGIMHGDYSAFVFLANGYVDLGTWYGITPFIGAGIGVAHNKLSGSRQSVTEIPVGGAAAPSGGWFGDGTKTSLAWALHAGLAYNVTRHFAVEMGYRYANLGEMKTGALNCFCGQTSAPLKVKDLEAHDFKLGMRWLLHRPVFTSAEPALRRD